MGVSDKKNGVNPEPIKFLREGGTNLLIILSGLERRCAAAARVTKMVLIKE